MAVDIGQEATDKPSGFDFGSTLINEEISASISGILTSIDIWALQNITGLIVGTFYTTNGNTLKCRASQAIAGTITAGSKVTKAVSIAVEIGDYIGCYWTGGMIRAKTSLGAGYWYIEAERIDPNDEAIYDFTPTRDFSLGGYITPPGWTGKISGVTNPAKIMGVEVANIAKVKGVA